MSARLALSLVFTTIACTQDNPAFGDSTSTAATTDDTSTTLVSTDVESGSGQEAPDPACELQPGVPLEIDLGPGGCADTPQAYDRYHPLVGIEGSTLLVGTCPQGATACSDACETAIPTPLSFAPLDLSTIAVPGDCLHIHARRLDAINPDVCRFESVVIESANANARRPILIGRNKPGVMLPAIDDSNPLAAFNPALVQVESCSCAEFPYDCCDGIETTLYALDIGQASVVHIGETVPIVLRNQDNYDFTTLDAFRLGECGTSTQEA
jgi:hypothetical protein